MTVKTACLPNRRDNKHDCADTVMGARVQIPYPVYDTRHATRDSKYLCRGLRYRSVEGYVACLELFRDEFTIVGGRSHLSS